MLRLARTFNNYSYKIPLKEKERFFVPLALYTKVFSLFFFKDVFS